MSEQVLWAAGLLAFRQKPEGGSEYAHTVALVRARTRAEAGTVAVAEAHRQYPSADGWRMHEATVTSMAEDVPMAVGARAVCAEVVAERERQIGLGYDAEHDQVLPGDWANEVGTRITAVALALFPPVEDPQEMAAREQAYRRGLVETAAVCVAAVEAFDRGAELV